MARITTVAPPVAHLVGPGQLRVVNGRLVFSIPGESGIRLDPKALQNLSCYGSVSFSDHALQQLLDHNVSVSILSACGTRCRGRVVGRHDSAALLRMQQHEILSNSSLQTELARSFVLGRITSQIQAVRHYQRHGRAAASQTLERLHQRLKSAEQSTTRDQLRGAEGNATAAWFEYLAQLFPAPWSFAGRNRRPPRDPVNALLSLSSTWLLNRSLAELQSRGLETTIGALHEFRHGRPSLACDVVEPIRVSASERWTLDVCRKQLVEITDFESVDGGVIIARAQFPRLLVHWERHWQESCEPLLTQTVDQLCKSIRSLSRTKQSPGDLTGDND